MLFLSTWATKGKRLTQGFGKLHGEKLEGDEDEEEGGEASERPGECPWDDCPEPGNGEWENVQLGYPENSWLEYNSDTRTSRVRDGPRPDDVVKSCFMGCGPLGSGSKLCPKCRMLVCDNCGGCFCTRVGS